MDIKVTCKNLLTMKFVLVLKTLLVILIFSFDVSAQEADTIKTIPYPLKVYSDPVSYIAKDTEVTISAKGKTNLFNNPNGKSNVNNAPMILFEPEGDFTLSAKVSGKLKAIYDVAALVVYGDENTWAKFCYENSVQKEPTIVSVVTRAYSDDCNSVQAGGSVYLAVVKKENEFSFFYSDDNVSWKMIRHFNLESANKLKVGFAVHGSRGNGFTATFSEIKYQDKALDDMRSL